MTAGRADMDARRTPPAPVPGIPRHTPDPTLERGFVASLRWLVAEGDARGVRRIAVELRALREALTTLDETRQARDEQAERAAALDREIQEAQQLLGDATRVNGNGSLVARLTRLRDILGRDLVSRRSLVQERDTWRAMCEFQTRTRAMVHTLLEESERARETLEAEVGTLRERSALLSSVQQETVAEAKEQRRVATMTMTELARLQELTATMRERVSALEQERTSLLAARDRVRVLERERDIAAQDARDASAELSALRMRLHQWSGTVDRALAELARASGAMRMDAVPTAGPATSGPPPAEPA
jgi:DNA repair exonuclease SbcCD ATPase subunit